MTGRQPKMYISVLFLIIFIIVVIGIGGKGAKCSNSAHDEWTEKDDEMARKMAYPKPTQRILKFFSESRLTKDQKRGKSYVAKFCQRCVWIAKDKLDREVSLH